MPPFFQEEAFSSLLHETPGSVNVDDAKQQTLRLLCESLPCESRL